MLTRLSWGKGTVTQGAELCYYGTEFLPPEPAVGGTKLRPEVICAALTAEMGENDPGTFATQKTHTFKGTKQR